MPRINLQDPFGTSYAICTRQETILKAWFDEVLPYTYVEGRPGTDDQPVYWPRIMVHPMWAWKRVKVSDPDWPADARVVGVMYEFPARDGLEGLRELARLRHRLEQQIAGK